MTFYLDGERVIQFSKLCKEVFFMSSAVLEITNLQ